MINVLKATPAQKNQLEGDYNNGHIIRFIEDADGNWILGVSILTDPNFAEINAALDNLPRIPYNPQKIAI